MGTLGASCRLLEELEFGWRRDGDSDHDDDAAQTEKQQPPQPPQHTPAATSVQRTAAPAKNWMTATVTIDFNATGDGDECSGSGSFTTATAVMDRLVDANPQLRRLVLDGVSGAGTATATTTKPASNSRAE